ncbi:MAG: DUF2130 domain-containing protein [Candidatus Levyibacteriota bacterium]
MEQTMNTIQCPHCKKQVELSEALTHQMRETVRAEQDAKHKIEVEKAKLELEQQEASHKKELELVKSEAEERALKRAKETLELELKNSQNEAEEVVIRNKKLQEQLLDMTGEIRKMKQKDGDRELEMKKTLLREREIIETEVTKSQQEKSRLEKMELQKKLNDTQKALEDAQRKAQQTSQQLQGEVLELELENQLKGMFPSDEIAPVPKGFEGADLLQTVRNKFGQKAGVILWETKRTKSWDGKWTAKLRENKRMIDANIPIIVSEVLPKEIDTFGYYENIWVTNYKYAIPLAHVLRIGLFELAVAKATTANKDERLEALFNYLVNDGFRNKFEAQVEGIIALKSDLESEQRTTITRWKKREMQLKRLMSNTATMYGELQGIMGEALPSLPSLDSGTLLAPGSEQESLLE